MKRKIILFFAGVLGSALCAGFVACNEPQGQEDIGTLPVPVSDVSDEVSAFLEEQLGTYIFDYFSGKYNEPVFSTINSKDELKAVVPSSVELPYIDFEKYTLVIGWYVIPSGGCFIKYQGVDTKPDVMILNLIHGSTGKGLSAVFWSHYWRLFPKLPQKPIALNYL